MQRKGQGDMARAFGTPSLSIHTHGPTHWASSLFRFSFASRATVDALRGGGPPMACFRPAGESAPVPTCVPATRELPAPTLPWAEPPCAAPGEAELGVAGTSAAGLAVPGEAEGVGAALLFFCSVPGSSHCTGATGTVAHQRRMRTGRDLDRGPERCASRAWNCIPAL